MKLWCTPIYRSNTKRLLISGETQVWRKKTCSMLFYGSSRELIKNCLQAQIEEISFKDTSNEEIPVWVSQS